MGTVPLPGAPDGVWALDLDDLFKVDKQGEIAKRTVLPYTTDAGAGGEPTVVADGSVWIAVRSAD
jgi:hypothetical protein